MEALVVITLAFRSRRMCWENRAFFYFFSVMWRAGSRREMSSANESQGSALPSCERPGPVLD